MSKEFTVIETEFDKINLIRDDFIFSDRFIDDARNEWAKSPGRYDGILMGVKEITGNERELQIRVFPMNYSWHRYIARTIATGKELPQNERIYPLCVVGLSYFQSGNKRHFITGIKKSGNIDGGKLECIPQGFCDMKDGSLDNYIACMIEQELHEEIGRGIRLNDHKIRALATDDTNFQYALMAEFRVEEDEIKEYVGKEGSEHELIMTIPESGLKHLIKEPAVFLKSERRIDISPMTMCALELYLNLH